MKKGEWIAVARHMVECYVGECGCPTPAIKELLNYMSIKDLKKEFSFQDDEIEDALKDKSESDE